MTTRIYIASPKKEAPVPTTRLVDATNAATARNHVTRDIYDIRPATGKEIAELVAGGVKVEKPGTEQQPTK